MSTPLPRVLLIEDDAPLRRFVAMALEEMAIELVAVPTVDDALQILPQAPVVLILTDLMLPGRSGFDLLDILAVRPDLQGQARVAVFSAGLNTKTRHRLNRPGIWRLLSKPCSVGDLEDCVRSALDEQPTCPALPPPHHDTDSIADVISHNFGGDTDLYHAFRTTCIAQFQADIAEGNRALEDGDAPAMRRLAHNLKSVLRMLGHTDASTTAADLEQACESPAWACAKGHWLILRAALEWLAPSGIQRR